MLRTFAFVFALMLVIPQFAIAQPEPEATTVGHHDHIVPRVTSFAESETELSFAQLQVGEIITAEVATRLARRLSLGGFVLANLAPDGNHFGGGFSFRYETDWIEGMTRIALDHRLSEFPDNIVRVELRGTVWFHPHIGFMLRGLLENFPSLLNEENQGRWDTVSSAGISYRPNHYFTVALLGTSRWSDMSHVGHLVNHAADPGLLLLIEGIVPLLR